MNVISDCQGCWLRGTQSSVTGRRWTSRGVSRLETSKRRVWYLNYSL